MMMSPNGMTSTGWGAVSAVLRTCSYWSCRAPPRCKNTTGWAIMTRRRVAERFFFEQPLDGTGVYGRLKALLQIFRQRRR